MGNYKLYFKGKPVVVSGASGFVGSNVVRSLLETGAHVVALARNTSDLWRLQGLKNNLSVVYLDLEDLKALEGVFDKYRPEHFINCAAPVHKRLKEEDKLRFFQDRANAQMEAIFNAIINSEKGLKNFTHVCSSTVYEWTPENPILGETTALNPATLRGKLKLSQLRSCEKLAAENGIPLRVARLFRVYGPWDFKDRFIHKLLEAAFEGSAVLLGNDSFYRDYIHVHDVCSGILKMTSDLRQDNLCLNLGSGKDFNPLQVAEILEELIGRRIPRLDNPYPKNAMDRGHYRADINQAKSILNWEPAYTLKEGLTQTLEWYISTFLKTIHD